MNPDCSLEPLSRTCTAFDGNQKVASGQLVEVVLAVKPLVDAPETSLLIFDDMTGSVLDIDFRGSTAEIISRLATHPVAENAPQRRPGRPKLGVIGREVTLLPRHWDWLASQKGGPSQTLRRLIDKARREQETGPLLHLAHERAYRFMNAIAGNFAGFEDAARALFSDDIGALANATETWPADVRNYALQLAQHLETKDS